MRQTTQKIRVAKAPPAGARIDKKIYTNFYQFIKAFNDDKLYLFLTICIISLSKSLSFLLIVLFLISYIR
jgi:hypothetical protein